MAGAGAMKKVVGISHFKVALNGLNLTHMRGVSGFNINFEEISEHTVDDAGKPERTRFPTAGPVWQELTLERALNADMDAWNWFKTSHIDGDWESQMKEGTLTLYDHKMQEVMVYNISEAWPSRYGVPGLAAGGSGMAIETMGVVAKFERTK